MRSGRYPRLLPPFPWRFLACLWLAACSQFSVTSTPPTAQELEAVLAGSSLPEEAITANAALDDQLLAANDAMRRFVSVHVPDQGSPRLRLQRILESLSDYDNAGIQYDPGITLNAADAFAHRQGNCLSLTAMVVTLAREAGLQAFFNEVDMPPTADMLNDNRIAFYKHVNAVVELGQREVQVVDLTSVDSETRLPQRRISDHQAVAQFHNNRAMELLSNQRPGDAFQHMRKAIGLSPDEAYLWSNLGTIYSRLGQYTQAEIAYRHAHHLDAGSLVAMSNLSRMYQLMDQPEKAERYREAVARVRAKHPYYLYILAKDALNRQEPKTALRYVKSAIRAQRDEPRFHRLAALIYQRLDEPEKMRGSLERAMELSMAADRLQAEQLTAAR